MAQISEIKQLFLKFESSLGTNQLQNPPKGGFFAFKLIALTDKMVRTAQPQEKAYKISDGNSLYLSVQPSGNRLWQMRYRHFGRENILSLGKYPEVTLRQARFKRDDAKRLLSEGIDPAADKKRKIVQAKIAHASTFDAVAAEFIELKEKEGLSPAIATRSV